ncbi:hypothetical protein GCM10018780_03310 [Streptomyces lanatus]|nr:hypothetical protein GCM10018780_03310 [Streptomyces lanatus]
MTAAASLLVITVSTPAGAPASRASSPRTREDRGVSAAGLSTAVQPAARAAATLRAAMAKGTFHGVISRQGPTGSATVTM